MAVEKQDDIPRVKGQAALDLWVELDDIAIPIEIDEAIAKAFVDYDNEVVFDDLDDS